MARTFRKCLGFLEFLVSFKTVFEFHLCFFSCSVLNSDYCPQTLFMSLVSTWVIHIYGTDWVLFICLV